MIRKIFILFIILSGSLFIAFSQNGITVKLVKSDASGQGISVPQFPGGEEALYKYFVDNLRYPSLLIKIEMEGDVHAKFIVKKDRSVANIEILRGFDPLVDDQIVEAIKNMPEWTPFMGTEELPVELIIDFKLNDELRNRLAEIEKSEKEADSSKKTVLSNVLTENSENQNENKTVAKIDTLQNKLPEFPGGQKALDEYIRINLKYPKRAIQMNIEGRVVFNLSVSSEGDITKIELFKGVYSECNEEGYYLIKRMPKWTPGLKDGKPVAMQVMIPIPFVLPR
ncbi:MAG: energy transducer TonB [Dysgonomonas sp.]